MSKPCIKDLTDEQVAELVGPPAFRLKQLQDRLYKKWALSFDEFSTFPKALREKLDNACTAVSLNEIKRAESSDGTEKYLFELQDGETIETALLRVPDRDTVCISTQVGCPVQCAFCASGKGGLVRNLTPAEIVDQPILVSRRLNAPINNIVVMGIGEPLLNFQHLVTALDTLCDPDKFGIGARRITVSTSGIVPEIRKLADIGRQWNLAFSLHAPDDESRAKLIPEKYRWPLEEIFEALDYYRRKTTRKVTLEYTLIRDANDSQQKAQAVARIARRLDAKVNLIPYNPTGDSRKRSSSSTANAFLEILTDRGLQATVRRRRGDDINAACGQLRRNSQDLGES